MTDRPDGPGPLLRRGPRPLLLHLTLAMLRSTASLAGSPTSNAGLQPSNAALAETMRQVLASLAQGAAQGAARSTAESPSFAQILVEDQALIAGIAAYRRHPWRRTLPDPPAIWEEGASRLLDYGKTAGDQAGGQPVLFVPSLVNRSYVLDLAPGRSMLRWLAGAGVHPLLLDWGWPGALERTFTITDYIAGRLERAMVASADAVGEPVVLAGYCMGGTLAVAAARRRPDLLAALALLAAPWDFHAADAERAQGLARMMPLFEPMLGFSNALPIDVIQTLFALLDPVGVAAKYRGFAKLPQQGGRAELFVALEDWLNDGVPLPAAVARECLGGWYGENTPGKGTWRVAGLAVDPSELATPTFVAVPARDRIVPPESARPLARLIPGAELHEPASGHIGMAAGTTAEAALWRPLRDWVHNIAVQRQRSRA
jgi:poly(3-hydroxyalkanoate) synthetase